MPIPHTVAAILLVASTAVAQGLRPMVGDIDVTMLVGTQARLVGSLTLTPDTPGDELLWFNGAFGPFVIVMAPNAPRSGFNGNTPTPGICVEPSIPLPFAPDSITITDVNGDGLSDLVLEAVQNGQPRHSVVFGERPRFCR